MGSRITALFDLRMVHGGTRDATLIAIRFFGRLFIDDRRLFPTDLFDAAGTTRPTTALHIRRLAFACR